jgi:hypothetical protein
MISTVHVPNMDAAQASFALQVLRSFYRLPENRCGIFGSGIPERKRRNIFFFLF